MLRQCTVSLPIVVLLSICTRAQSVISARSGLILAAEGAAFLDDQPVVQSFRLSEMAEGSTLRTAEGRAEVLLTPDIVLRVWSNSAIRMISNKLSDTQVEFLSGSAILEARDVQPDTDVVIIFGEHRIRLPKQGSYRIDAGTGRLRVNTGETEISRDGSPTLVREANLVSLDSGTVTSKLGYEPDAFDRWSQQRSRLNALAASKPAPGKKRRIWLFLPVRNL